MVGDNVEKMLDTFANPPWTAYNPEAMEDIVARANTQAAIGSYYCPELGAYVAAWPMQLQIATVSFFGKYADYWRAYSTMTLDKVTLTRWRAPILINGNPVDIVVSVNMQISKGSYAGAFEEYLRQQKIIDLVCTFTLDYVELKIIDPSAGSEFEVYPVDELILHLKKQSLDGKDLGTETTLISGEPEITSTSPTADATGVALSDPVVLNFNLPMDPYSVEDSLSIIPAKDVDFIWNSNDTQLTIKPRGGWAAATQYTIDLVAETTQGGLHQHPMVEDLVLKFTTV